MAREMRRIILSQQEFADALGSYRRAYQGFLPSGAIVECGVNSEAKARVKVQMATESGAEVRDFYLDQVAVTNVLIRFCIENNISLPRVGAKRAVAHAGEPSLEIRLGDIDPAVAVAS
jgi:hypothetical protein